MGSNNFKSGYLNKIAVVLVLVFIVASAFLGLEVWEKKHGSFVERDDNNGVIKHNGKEYVLNDDIETFLVLGLDQTEGIESLETQDSGVRADFLMLLVFNNETKQTTAIHINRDTMTKVNKLSIGGTTVVDSFVKQIALSYTYVNDDNDKIRCRNAKDSVEYLLNGINVDHYLSLTMEAVSASCDLVGGVEVTVLDDFTGIDDTLVKGETVMLTGEQALRYVRTRYGLEDSSNSARMARQQQYINALYDKIEEKMSEDEEFVLKMVETMDKHIVYDSSNHDMQKIAEKFDEYEFLGIRELEGESILGEEYIEFYPDEAALKSLVVEMFYTLKPH